MAYTDIFRVRKNKEHRRGLSKEQPAVLSEHEAGLMELADAELDHAAGGIYEPPPPPPPIDPCDHFPCYPIILFTGTCQ